MDIASISELFKQKGLSLGSIESFTGGSFASDITSLPGASKFYKGSLITYATEEKARLLGISWDTINKYGVCSQEVAGEMAGHGKALLDVDVAVSFTGNAGPIPMENKPVGEIYIGVAFLNMCQVYQFNLSGDRKNIQKEAINIACQILEKIILNNF